MFIDVYLTSLLGTNLSRKNLLKFDLALQSPNREDEEDVDADGANYQLEMMRCLREINVDNNTVGW